MVVFFALGNAKLPNADGFASQWNIGFMYMHLLVKDIYFTSQITLRSSSVFGIFIQNIKRGGGGGGGGRNGGKLQLFPFFISL